MTIWYRLVEEKKDLRSRVKYLEEAVDKLKDEIIKLLIDKKILEFEKQLRDHQQILDINRNNHKFILAEFTPKDMRDDTYEIDLVLYSADRHSIKRTNNRLYAKCNLNNNNIFIIDILCDPNLGIGTMFLNSLIAYAKKNNFNSITGRLSDVDLNDHGDRLFHFYRKNGFTISGDKVKIIIG